MMKVLVDSSEKQSTDHVTGRESAEIITVVNLIELF